MKILIFTHLFPWPLNEGGRVAQYGILASLAEVNEVVLAFPEKNTNQNDRASLRERIPRLKLRGFGDVTTEPEFTFFQKVVRKIIWKLRPFLPKRTKGIPENDFFLNPVRARSEFQFREVRKICVEENPDILQVDFIDNADIGLICPGNIRKVLVVHDLRFESVQRAALQEKMGNEYVNYLSKIVKLKEIPFLNKFEGVITFSRENAELLSEEKIENVFVSPFSIDNKYFSGERQNGKVSKLAFLGPDHHTPNLESLEWFAQNVSNELHEEFGLKVQVIGNWSKRNIERFKGHPEIQFCGFVEDIIKELQDSVLIVPLKIGSGIRTKILEAFAMRIPVISSKVGIEGIGAEHGKQFILAENKMEYIDGIRQLLNDPEYIMRITENAFELVRSNFSPEVVCDRRLEIINAVLKGGKS